MLQNSYLLNTEIRCKMPIVMAMTWNMYKITVFVAIVNLWFSVSLVMLFS